MQTPIDFGKNFLNNYFSMRDPDRCLEDLAYDVVWITPKQMYHFLSAVEINSFLQEEMTARPERHYVDIVSIKSSPSAADISTVAYEINLVPREGEKAVYLRCSMAIVKRGQHFEITFLHMSERQGQGGMDQIREFTENLPCGVLIFAYMEKEGLKTLFYNDYFWNKLRYKEDQFRKQMERDPFFMVPEEERDKIMARLKEIQGTGGHIAVNLTFYRKDGNRFQYRMLGAPAYQEGDNTVYYCIFQETTGFNQIHSRLQERIASASEILAKIPGSLCVLAGESGNWHPVYVSREFPEQFGLSMAGFADQVAKDPFYGLEMTSYTRERLTKSHLEQDSEDPYLGAFEMERKDGTKRWTDVYLVSGTDHNGSKLRMLFYVDKDAEKRAVDQQIAKAENTSKMQQERARTEIREAQEKARQQVEEAQTTVKKEIEEAQAKTLEQIEAFRVKMNEVLDSQKGSIEIKEKQMRLEFEAREQEMQRSYAEKEKMLEKQLENYKKAQDAELVKQQKAVDQQLAECGREIENKQAEIERLGQELTRMMESLRESEAKREQERRSSDLRDREHEKTVKRLRAMVESVRKLSDAGGYMQEDTAGGYAQDNTAGGYAQDGAAGGYAQDGAAGGYAQGGAAEDYAYDSAGEGYVPDGGTYDNGAEGYAPDTAADDYGWMGDMAEPPAGGVIRRGAVNDRSRKPFAGQGLRPDRPTYPGASAGMKNMNRSGSPTGTGGMNRAGSPAGTGGMNRAGSPAGAGGMNRAGSPAGTGGMNRAGSPAGAGVMNRAGSPAGAGGMNRSGSAPRGVTAENTPVRSSVMDDLVQMASADDGVLKEELFSVDECLENIMMLQEPVCVKKKIHLEYKRSVSMPAQAIGDKSKLQRALVSLLESVVEQTPSGSVISVGGRADRASGNRAYFYFTIRDNGSNLASDLMQGMFEMKDERDDPLRAGLYIAREIISTMGGNVRVRSRRGEGTEFMVTVIMKLP